MVDETPNIMGAVRRERDVVTFPSDSDRVEVLLYEVTSVDQLAVM